jgi:hypothetical protein
MSPLAGALRALYGAYRLVLLDKSGFSYFDTSISGFWRSFTAAFLISPFFFTVVYTIYITEQIDTPLSKHMSHEISAYVLSWLVFPVLMEQLTKLMGCRDKYINFIVAYNWAIVPQYTVFIILLALGLIGIIPPELSDSLSVMLLVWTFFYAGFIVKSMLQVSLQTTTGIIIMDFLLGLTIDLTITG